MPDFAYTARDSGGNRTSGVVSASSQRDAVAMLANRSLFPLEVKAEQAAARLRQRRVRGELLATTYSQLAALLHSGVSLLRALEVIGNQTSHTGLTAILEDIRERVRDGASLADAMARHPATFNETTVSIVRAGGEGGFLEDSLQRVATFSQRQEDLKSKTIGALIYPVILAVICVLVVSGILVFLVPLLEGIFARLAERGHLPILTTMLLATSVFVRKWGLLLFGVMVAGALFFHRHIRGGAGRRWFDALKLRLPMAGSILQSLSVSRFCRVLGTMLRNGVPILRALEISRDATGNRVLSDAIAAASDNISEGQALAQPLSQCDFFPRDVVEMIAVAEESNTLDTVLIDIADRLERQTTRRLDLMVRLLEPMMLMLMAAIVLVLAVALLLPVLNMHRAI